MNNLVDKLSEAREHIRLELKRLSDRETELNDKFGGLRAYIDHLEALLEKTAHASSNLTLEEVIRLGELKAKTRPSFFKMSKYTIEKEVREKLDSARRELEELLVEVGEIKRSKEDANVCPDCGGIGQRREIRYVREDGMVRQVLKVRTCPLCGGSGRID